MSWKKLQLVTEAFNELALQGFVFDITPEEQQTALQRLDAMMATWEARGIRVGYAFPASPESSGAEDPSGLPDSANEPVFMNLAVRLAAGYGKALSADTKRTAREGYGLLLRAAAMPSQQQFPSTLPRGAGNRLYSELGRPFFPQPDPSPLQTGPGPSLTILQE